MELKSNKQPSLEIVAELSVRPGDVAVSPDGRVFSTIHPLGETKIQLVEIKDGKAIAFPNMNLQKGDNDPSGETLDSPLGIVVDKRYRLWTIDIGLGFGKSRIWCFDLRNKSIIYKIEIPELLSPVGSFVQDLAVDDKYNWVFLADISPAGLLAIDLNSMCFRRFENIKLESEDIDMVIDGEVIMFGGKPARVGINPITLSDDRETLYFGAMNGTSWYKLPTKLFRDKCSDEIIAQSIGYVGPKPISDGCATDSDGNHYFTDLQQHAISCLSNDLVLTTLIKDSRLQWTDNVAVGPDKWLYVTVNQLTTTPAFTSCRDNGIPPYYIFRFNIA